MKLKLRRNPKNNEFVRFKSQNTDSYSINKHIILLVTVDEHTGYPKWLIKNL